MSVTINGLEGVLRNIKNIGDGKWMHEPMQATVDEGLNVARTYAPRRPGQRYIRTGTLYRSFAARVEGRGLGIKGRIFSRGAVQRGTRYEQDVKLRSEQAPIHQGRWPVIEDDAKIVDKIAVRNFTAAANKLGKL